MNILFKSVSWCVNINCKRHKIKKESNYKQKVYMFIAAFFVISNLLCDKSYAMQHVVQKGDTMWLIAKRYQIGLTEIINANAQIINPNLIYPGEILNIPEIEMSILSYEEEVVRLTNLKRKENGLNDLTINWELSRVARYKSQDMHDKKYFSHTSPTYGSPFDMMKSFGLSYMSAGENIAKGQRTPKEVVEDWWNSPGHRSNMLNSTFTQIGVGFVSDGNYWTQMFIGK